MDKIMECYGWTKLCTTSLDKIRLLENAFKNIKTRHPYCLWALSAAAFHATYVMYTYMFEMLIGLDEQFLNF